MPEMISIACDICGQPYRRSADELGKKAKCRVCGTTFRIVPQKEPDELFDSEESSEGNALPWIKGGATSGLILLIIFGLGSLLFLPARQRERNAEAQRRVARNNENPVEAQPEERTRSLAEMEPTANPPVKVPPREVPKAVDAGASPENPLQEIVNDVFKESGLVPIKINPVEPVATPAGTAPGRTGSVSAVASSRRAVDRDISDRYQLVETSSAGPGMRMMHGIPVPSLGLPSHGDPRFPVDFSRLHEMNPALRRSRSLHQSVRDRIRERSSSSLRRESNETNGSTPQKP